MAKVEDLRTFDGDTLHRLRDRAQHVIVVMLENRSFDQLLGLLDHHDRPSRAEYFVDVGSCPNPNGQAPNSPQVTVTDSGGYVLPRDPPHGHQPAIDQMHFVDGKPRMDGFVNAYAQKLTGREVVPKKQWFVIVPVALVLLAACGFAIAEIVRRIDHRGPWLLFASAAIVAVVALYDTLWSFPALSHGKLLCGSAAAGTIVTSFVFGWFHMGDLFDRWIVIIVGAVGALVVAAVALWGWKSGQPPKPAPMNDAAAALVAPSIMACLPSDKVPVLSFLAKNYVTCVQWYSSVPGATWPNRNFAHAATSDESTDIEAGFYRDRTIFELLDSERNKRLGGDDSERTPWRVFFHDTPQVIAFRRLWRRKYWNRWHSAEGLLGAIESGKLPTYSFVEPCHNSANGSLTSSQHPGNNEESGDDFLRGELLIGQIYTQLALHPAVFNKTVLIITYDEHGGIHDHRKPPPAVPPESGLAKVRARTLTRRLITWVLDFGKGYSFDRLGMRVPTVIVSPWVAPGAIDETVYDHTSIVASMRRLWAPHQRPLSDRDKAAHDIWDLLDDANAIPQIAPPPDWGSLDPAEAPIGRSLVSTTPPPTRPATDSTGGDNIFSLQLAKLDRRVAQKLPTPPSRAEGRGRETESGIAKLRALGDFKRNGNPSPQDF